MKERGESTGVLDDLSPESQEVFAQGAEKLRQGYPTSEEGGDDIEFKDTDPRLVKRAQEIAAEIDELAIQVFQPITEVGEKKQALLRAEELLAEAEDINRRNNTIAQDLERLTGIVERIRANTEK